MEVYFTTSTLGVNENKQNCRLIVNTIEDLGHELTLKWIKLATDVKEPLKGREANPKQIFKENLDALMQADVAIFEITHLSGGLGYQIAYSLAKGISTLCLYKEGTSYKNLSNFLPGIASDSLTLEKYGESTLKGVLVKYIAEQEKETLIKFNFIANKEIKNYIEWASEKAKVSKSKCLRDLITKEIIRKDEGYQKRSNTGYI